MDVTNTGDRKGDDVVQLYINDPVASISQPVRRLRGFQRVTLDPGQKQTVTFTLDKSDFGFYDNRGRFVVEPGQIDVYGGDSSTADLKQSFTRARLLALDRAGARRNPTPTRAWTPSAIAQPARMSATKCSPP